MDTRRVGRSAEANECDYMEGSGAVEQNSVSRMHWLRLARAYGLPGVWTDVEFDGSNATAGVLRITG